MRAKDIIEGKNYAVVIPGAYRNEPKRTVQGRVTSVLANLKEVTVTTNETGTRTTVRPRDVLMPWQEYACERDHGEALREDIMRTLQARAEAEAARREQFIAAFEGLMVEAQGSKIDLADYLRETFLHAVSASVSWDVFEQIALRLKTLEAIAQQNALIDVDADTIRAMAEAEQEASNAR